MNKTPRLSTQILASLVLGAAVGLLCSLAGLGALTERYLKPFGDIFINLLKFTVVPVVLFSMLEGFLSMDDMKKAGAVGLKTVGFFLCTTAVACVIGLSLAAVFNSAGLFPDLSGAAQAAEYQAGEYGGFMATLVNVFPSNLWQAFANADMLQVIVIAFLFGGAIMAAGERARLCREIVSSFYAVVEQLTAFVIRLAPIGVFTYMAWVVATQGAAVLGSLALVLLCAYIAYALHAAAVYALAVKAFAGMGPLAFFKGASAAMIFAFTSASSAAALPVSKACSERMGADRDLSAFVLSLGATINMDGTAIYQCVSAVFLASCAGMRLTLGQMALVAVTATLASVGTAGVSGAGMLMLAMALEAAGIPVSYIGLIVAVDRLFDMGRTCLNVTGDIACALCVSKWERAAQ